MAQMGTAGGGLPDEPRTTRAARRATGVVEGSLRNYSAVWILAVFIGYFGLTQGTLYVSISSLQITLSGQVTVGMLAFAVLIPLSAGAFDLSVGGNIALGTLLTCWLPLHGVSPVLAAIIAIAACTGVGVCNGFIVLRLGVSSFIATLAVSEILAAIELLISGNQEVAGSFPMSFTNLAQGSVFGITYNVYLFLALALLLWYVLEHTPAGRFVYATGGNAEAARIAGVRTQRVVWWSLTASGSICGLAGVIYAAQVTVFSNDFGPPLLFPAFAAVFFGATQVKDRPNVWGTVLALYALAAGVKGLQLSAFGSEYWITPALNGLALLLAVIVATRRRAGRSRRPSTGRSREAGRGLTDGVGGDVPDGVGGYAGPGGREANGGAGARTEVERS